MRNSLLKLIGALLGAPSLLLAAGSPAQAQTYSCDSSNVCTVAAGYSNVPPPAELLISSSNYSVTSNATLEVNLPMPGLSIQTILTFQLGGASGANSSDDDAGNGSPSGALTFTNAGTITQQSVGNFSSWAATVRAWTTGGAGGNYTDDNAKHNAGFAANGGTTTFTNSAPITVYGDMIGEGGAAILAESHGGAGGNVTSTGTDGDGNPDYNNQTGTAGGAGGAVIATNNATISVSGVNASTGYWAFAARSKGGNGGTGNDGTAGGSAGSVTLTSNSPVSLGYQWASLTSQPGPDAPVGAYAVTAISLGGTGNMSVNSGNDGGAGGAAGPILMTINAPVTLNVSTPSGIAVGTGAAVGAFSTGGAGGLGYEKSYGGRGGAGGQVTVGVSNATIAATGDFVSGVVARALGGPGGSGNQGNKDPESGQDSSNGGGGGNGGSNTDATKPVGVTITNATVTTAGTQGPGVLAISQGGPGGTGANWSQALSQGRNGCNGGGGGNTSVVTVDLKGTTRISTTGSESPAVVAATLGGQGGAGGSMAGGRGRATPARAAPAARATRSP